MRFRLLIPIAAALALSACNEAPTPKPSLPSKVTAPIAAAPAAAPAALPAQPAAVCPPQPQPVCPPVATKTAHKAKPAVVRRKTSKAHRRTTAKTERHYRRYEGGAQVRGHEYAEREESWSHRDRHRHHREGQPPQADRYAYAPADHYHAYGQSGAVTHFAQPYERAYGHRQDDRYSAGGRSYESYERSESYSYSEDARGGRAYADRESYRSDGGRYAAHGYAESDAQSSRSSWRYSERAEDSGSWRRTEVVSGGCCIGGEAAGRDPDGFLTWPGKVPAAPY
ncbi:MAG: hypothetical protein ACK4YQ_03225 [Phenylobacterium sp.]|uniref:hypothetical protein n=1 Tax=Phenylobacterium sp. TaxID=1871053 RepID=UPI00391957A5